MNELRQEKSVAGQSNGQPNVATWVLNLEAAGRAQRWSQENPALLQEEATEMLYYFPSWLLVAVREEQPLRCEGCGELMVWKAKGLACAGCDRNFKGRLRQAKLSLAWIGHLPAPIPTKGLSLERLEAHPDPTAPLVRVGGQPYVLVPLLACYPENWPQRPPLIHYDRDFLNRIGIQGVGHSTHLVGTDGTTMCLYTSWRAVTLRVVLQQRVVNHVVSLFKIVQGVQHSEAFLDH
ncbi:MAG: hypothetical protein WCS37_21135 [Chloroflexota bacterium]|nr:hypothetical protein [Chloroflexota bacterium]